MTFQLLTYSGVPRAGNIITVQVSDSNGNSKTVTYTVVIGDDVPTIVSNLAALITDSNFLVYIYNLTAFYVYSPDDFTVTATSSIFNPDAKTIAPYTWSFNEKRNGYCSFYTYYPEWILSAEDVIYTWLNGNLYVHNNTAAYCNFYGTQYDASITLVFNINLLEKKTWQSVTEVASAIWACPMIYTNVKSNPNQTQESQLGDFNFRELEGNFHSSFLRDKNSARGLLNGSFLKGNYLVVKFQKQAASNLIYLSQVSVMFRDSPLTSK